MMNYHKNILHIEGVPVGAIARAVGTPFFAYSAAALESNFDRIAEAFTGMPHLVCYSVKSNATLAVLKLLADRGSGADIVSGGELARARAAGIPPSRIVYSGVGKTAGEIRAALRQDILMFNVESVRELEAISRAAVALRKQARIALRVNPDIAVDTHHHITTGRAENKFGVHYPHVFETYLAAARLPGIEIVGVQMHLGSQIKEFEPYLKGVKKLADIINALSLIGVRVRYLDIGGGFGIAYTAHEKVFPVRRLASALSPVVRRLGVTLIMEPGRYISGPAGSLVCSVIYDKYVPHKNFVIVDAAMNDLIRPALYGAYHRILPVVRRRGPAITADIVGPVCESGDFFAKGREIQPCMPGDLLVVANAGAYGFAMSSNYNSRPRAAEVMVRGGRFQVVRTRETARDLMRGERIFNKRP